MKLGSRDSRSSFLHARIPTGLGLAMTVAIMAILIGGVYAFDIPNPNMILIAGLVVCSALFGYPGGATAGVIMALYTLYFFSTGNDFVSFTPVNLTKVLVSMFGIVVDMVFVCALKRREMLTFREVDKLTEDLKRDNELLQQASMIDSLTTIRNRFALRRDYAGYAGQNVYVLLMDMDEFKSINDTYGHDMGDFFLRETGKLLARVFGQGHCYRYGGDEFLVICPGMAEAEFVAKLNEVLESRPSMEADGQALRPNYSYGYTCGRVRENDDLRNLFTAADERMYAMKRQRAA